MFAKRIELFTLLGFPVRIDASWFLLAFLVTWTLAAGVFPRYYEGLPPATYWIMGALGALGLFASILLHELSHSLVARRHGLPMRGITLFIFGGVAEMPGEPPSPHAEFLMAVAGPLASVGVALGCFGLSWVGRLAGWPVPLVGVLAYLALINGVLVLFNLIPAFPLDGGRVLRSALWKWKGSLRWATRASSRIGAGFGVALMILGAFALLSGNLIGGMWYIVIGLFLRGAAQTSYQQLLVRRALEGEPIRRFMTENPVSVPRKISVRELVEDYIYRHYRKLYPVVDDGRLVGCVSTRQVKGLPREDWDRQTVGALAEPCNGDNTVPPDLDAMRALSQMTRTGTSRLMVVEGDRLVGVVSLKDLLKYFSLKMELEDVAG